VKSSIAPIDFDFDFDFGTFNFKGDASMAFLLALIVIFLLFDKKRNHIVRHKWPVSLWLTLTILIANAELVKLIILLVWGVYLLRHLSPKTIIYTVGGLATVVIVLASLGVFDEIWSDFTYSLVNNARIDFREGELETFLSGNYARGAAIAYYINRGVLWLGDGPSKYYNVFTRERMVGNTGHIFTFYS